MAIIRASSEKESLWLREYTTACVPGLYGYARKVLNTNQETLLMTTFTNQNHQPEDICALDGTRTVGIRCKNPLNAVLAYGCEVSDVDQIL
jgi:hypothetical protein